MKAKQGKLLFFGVIVTLIVLSLGTVSAQGATWTIMVYMEADNNLEGDALADILEMELVGSTDDVNIVLQIDRAEDYSKGDGNWTDARRYILAQNSNIGSVQDIVLSKLQTPDEMSLASEPIEELGEINNGDPQTLVDFIIWADENYPAEKYALVLWNHGGTWSGGFGGDESTPNHDSMNLPELDAALDLATEAIGQNFEMIGFDTCLMGQYEVFMVLSKYSHYAAASEELEPGFGWYYTPAIQALVDNPAMDGAELSQNLVRSYHSFYDELWLEWTGQTYSDFFGGDVYGQTAADLSQMNALNDALTNFSQVARANMDAALIGAIGDARNNTQMFMLSSPDDAVFVATVDLRHFMELLPRFSNNADVNAAAQNVASAIDSLVLLHQATNMSGARGLSIYFPANKPAYAALGFDARYAQELPFMSEWIAFLEAFYGEAQATASSNVGRVTITNLFKLTDPVNTLNPPTLVFETEGTNITELSFSAVIKFSDEVQFMVDLTSLVYATITEDGEPIVDIPDGVSSTHYTWTVDMPVITDGNVSVPTVLLETGDDENLVVTGLYGYQSGQTIDSYMVFDVESQRLSKVWGINEAENGGQPFEINVTAGDEFLPTWRYFDENGELQLIPAEDVLVFGTEPISYDFVPAASGTYALTVYMTDVAGNVFSDTVEIDVDNSDMDTNYRGDNDVYSGYHLVYPWAWIGATDVEDAEGAIRTEYIDNDGKITVYLDFYDVSSLDEIGDIGYEYLDGLEYNEPQAIVVGGYDAYMVEYKAETDDGEAINGAMIAVYVAESGIGYLIEYEVIGEATADAENYFYVLLDSLSFFIPIE